MKIIVCVKRTPDTTTQIRVKPDKSGIEQDIEWILNPYDELAVEEALKLKEKNGGIVTAISLDPDANNSVLRRCLAMGVDEACLLKGGKNYDSYSVAKLLADEIKQREYNLVLFGKQAIDDDNYQVPSMVATLLDVPWVSVVTKVEVNGDSVCATRQIEGGEEIMETKFPCVISCQRGLNEPRYPSLKGIMLAKKKEIPVKEIASLPESVAVTGHEAPSPRPPGRIVGEGSGAVKELVRLLKEEAKVL
ncbi:MAG: electron transfer flavoprotein subunit beta/FixA family protein [Planctomycetes bacterium]|nr:electron transfer flavoprotein subunit beta/FixA family protein [Planctomycetota bacterium]